MIRKFLIYSGFLLAGTTGVAFGEASVVKWEELIPVSANSFLSPGDPQSSGTYVPPVHDENNFDDTIVLESPAFPTGVVETLNGQEIRIPGYIVPLELDSVGNVREFFLVPYVGACVHLPPPPPNQIVYVLPEMELKLESMWEPFWIEGMMSTEQHISNVGIAGYTVRATKIEVFDGW